MIQVNPSGATDCDASHLATGKVVHTGGLTAQIFTAVPVSCRLSDI